MSNKLTVEQIAYLRSQPLVGWNKLLQALRIAGLTQDRFADVANVNVFTLSRVVNGNDAFLTTARAIAFALGVGVDDLFPPNAKFRDQKSKARGRKNGRRKGATKTPKAMAA
jgi:transcriptional regulator with XRE-family HTH domain